MLPGLGSKFSRETRLESESFEPLIDFLAFLVQTSFLNYLVIRELHISMELVF